jgi:hypothetical protein
MTEPRSLSRRWLDGAFTALVGLIIMVTVFSGTARAAQAAATPDPTMDDLLAMGRAVIDAFRGGHSIAAGALAVVLLVGLAKRYGGKVSPKLERFLHGDVGGPAAVFLTAFAGSVAIQAQGPWKWAILTTGFGVGAAAIGGYVALRKFLIDPILASAWYAKAPAWIKVPLSLLTFLASKPPAIATAEKAGEDAVKASPAEGVDSIAGPATKF